MSFFALPIVLATLAFASVAVAKPRVGVAPLEGDSDDKISDVVAEEAGKSAKVTGPDEVGKSMESLGIRDLRSMRALKKLRVRLEVDAIVYGKIEREGGKKRLKLTVSGRAKKAVTFEVEFKTTSSKTFRKGLRDELATHITTATEGDAHDDDTDEDDEPKKKKLTDDDDANKKKHADDGEPKKKHDDDGEPKKKHDDDDHPRRRVADDDEPARVRKHHDDDDDDHRKTHKKKRRHRDDDAEPAGRHPTTQAALWLDAGATGVRRTLTYDTTDVTTPPPRVGTGAAAAQFEGEVYPLALSGGGAGGGAGLGLAFAVRRTMGLSIAVPGTNVSAGIKEGQYSIGARYRLAFGTTTLAVGLDYWRRYYYADRSALAMPGLLDMPDVEYTAVAPGAVVKVAATPTIGLFLGLQVPAMLGTGPIGAGGNYGKATAIAFEFQGGVDVALATNYGVRVAAMFDQVGLSFKADPGTLAARRQVSAVTDRTMGISATFAVFY